MYTLMFAYYFGRAFVGILRTSQNYSEGLAETWNTLGYICFEAAPRRERD